MGNKKSNSQTRRGFFTGIFSGTKTGSGDKIKLLTAEGKLVEVDKEVLRNAATGKKAANRDIYRWMKNPSKKQGS